MPSCTVKHLFAVTLAAIGASFTGACSVFGGPGAVEFARNVELPPDLCAAITAGAVRRALAFADPVPAAGGAPACSEGAGCFTITYECDAGGLWSPAATHRLIVATDRSARVGVVAQRLPPQLVMGPQPHTTARVHLRVEPRAGGASVRGTLAGVVAQRVALCLDRAFTLAIDPEAASPGLDEPNLETLACLRLTGAANGLLEHGRPKLAERHLQRVARLRHGTSALHLQLGELAAQRGDDEAAREQLAIGILMAKDPTTRAHAARALSALGPAGGGVDYLYDQARQRATAADFDGAEALLHPARRQHAQPGLDYRLSGQLHMRRNEDMSALGCALLAREHELESAGSRTVDATRPRGIAETLRRLMVDADPAAADIGPTLATPAAAPTR
jgi:hypothetical protein